MKINGPQSFNEPPGAPMVGRATPCAPRYMISGVQRTARPTAQRFFNIECFRDQDGSTFQ